MPNRQAATDTLCEWVDKILPGGKNGEYYRKRLDALSNKAFDDYMQKLQSGEEIVSLVAPNLNDIKLSLANNLKVAKQLNHNFFERLWLTDPSTGVRYLTPVKYLVGDLPIRRQQQLLDKKISIPADNNHVDDLSGQPTGPSKGAKISFPELQVLYAQGLDRSIEELIKFRGGDTKAFQAMNRQILETGGANQDSIKRVKTTVKSTETLNVILKAMHFKTTLDS